MKKFIILLAIAFLYHPVIGQSWGQADSCHVNVNDPAYQNFGRKRNHLSDCSVMPECHVQFAPK